MQVVRLIPLQAAGGSVGELHKASVYGNKSYLMHLSITD